MNIFERPPHFRELSPPTYVVCGETFKKLLLQYGESCLLSILGVDTLVVRNLEGAFLKTLTRPV